MNANVTQVMAKTIAIADDVYGMLSKEKRPGESFSDVIRRIYRNKGDLREAFGILADIPEDEFLRFRNAALSVDRPISKELGWKKRKKG